jgi:hypothetical protein
MVFIRKRYRTAVYDEQFLDLATVQAISYQRTCSFTQ